jgi:ubiquinone/menaquinone biosynthesis C-methylase UbiE
MNKSKKTVSQVVIDKLHLGCGADYKTGWFNVDILKSIRADNHFDLNRLPYPFKDNQFKEVLMKMILEHLHEPLKILKEIIRITDDGGKLTIIVPHATSYANLTDLQHKTNFTENSFNKALIREYDLEELELIQTTFIFKNSWKKLIPLKKFLKIFLNGIYEDISFEFRIHKV